MESPHPTSRTSALADQAIEWLLLLRSNRATEKDYAEFRAWRDADPGHHQAWCDLTSSLDGAAYEGLNDAPPTGKKPAIGHSRRRFLMTAGLCTVGTGTLAYASNMVYPWRNLSSDAATGTSERRRYTLSDGSTLLLDARSSVNLSYTPHLRQLNLRSGAVKIEAASDDPRPFLTTTAEGMIRSSGARYMVRQDAHRTLVVAHDAPVHIETRAGAHTVLTPGQGVRFDAARLGDPSQDMAARAAWERGLIIARGVTLNEIVSTLRPYYSGTLRVTVAAGGLPVFGEYSLDDVNGTLRSLEADLPITVQRFTPWLTSIEVAAHAVSSRT